MSTAVVAAYLVAYNRLRLLTGAQVAALWDRHGGLTDETQARFLARVLPLMAGAEIAQARLTAAYLTALRQQTLGSAPRVNLNVNDLVGTNLRGVDPAEVFTRPTVTARTAISDGHDFTEAMKLARIRATDLATTNVMLTQRSTVAAMGKTDKRVVGYRRVLTGDSCNLCVTVSTQRYHRGDLHPIHSHCDCGVAEIYGTADPGHVINSKLLAQLKDKTTAEGVVRSDASKAAQRQLSRANTRIGEIRDQLPKESDPGRRARLQDRLAQWEERKSTATTTMADNRRRLPDEPVIHIHGELGPLLTVKGQHFDGPSVVH